MYLEWHREHTWILVLTCSGISPEVGKWIVLRHIFVTRSSLMITISCVQYWIRQGFDVKMDDGIFRWNSSVITFGNGILWRKCYRCCMLVDVHISIQGQFKPYISDILFFRPTKVWANQLPTAQLQVLGLKLVINEFGSYVCRDRFSRIITGSLSLLSHCNECAESDVAGIERSLVISFWLLFGVIVTLNGSGTCR